jgi:RNA polymerase sigma-70 factor (ECF subfamily)
MSKGASEDARGVAASYADLVTPSRHLAVREELARVEAAMDRLSEDHREVITLARIAGLSHREIAAVMGRSEAACRVLLHRATAQLGMILGELDAE